MSQQAHPSFPRRETFAPPSLPRANRRSRRACPREVGGGNPSLAPGHRPTRSCRSSTSVVPATAGTHPTPVAAGPPSFPRRRDLCTTVHSHAHNRRSRGGGNPSPAPGLHPTPSCRSSTSVVPATAGTHPRPLATVLHRRVAAGPPVVPATAGTHPRPSGSVLRRRVAAGPPVVPATAGTHPRPSGSVLRRRVAAAPSVVPATAGTHPRPWPPSYAVVPQQHVRHSRGEPAPYSIRGGNPSPALASRLHRCVAAVPPSFPRRACPVLDTGREPIPGPGLSPTPLCRSSTSVVPAESLPRTRYGAGTHPRPLAPGLRDRVAAAPHLHVVPRASARASMTPSPAGARGPCPVPARR